jgi:diaminohydroxyphosphoribosylaminopyrimidine deaminase / 5-amino-6-(5-phosphoribosylamino)uracil reductase
VDRVHLFVSPQIMGSDAVPAFKGMAHAIHMAEVEVERYGNDLGLCSLLKDPWPKSEQLPIKHSNSPGHLITDHCSLSSVE